MKRRIIVAGPVMVGALGLLAGCASLLPKQKYIPKVSWPLNPPFAQSQAGQSQSANEAGKVVLLRNLDAGPGMSDQAIQTLEPDGSLTTSYYNHWAVAPADAASETLGTWLTASGAFSAVVSPGSRLSADIIVEGELTELLTDLGKQQGLAVLTVVVIQDLKGNIRPLAQQRITGTAPLTGTGYAAQVAAQTAALANAIGQAVRLVTRFT